MPASDTLDPTTQAAIEAAVSAALRDNHEWLRDLIQEALVEAATAEAHREEERRAALVGSHHGFPAQRGQA